MGESYLRWWSTRICAEASVSLIPLCAPNHTNTTQAEKEIFNFPLHTWFLNAVCITLDLCELFTTNSCGTPSNMAVKPETKSRIKIKYVPYTHCFSHSMHRQMFSIILHISSKMIAPDSHFRVQLIPCSMSPTPHIHRSEFFQPIESITLGISFSSLCHQDLDNCLTHPMVTARYNP